MAAKESHKPWNIGMKGIHLSPKSEFKKGHKFWDNMDSEKKQNLINFRKDKKLSNEHEIKLQRYNQEHKTPKEIENKIIEIYQQGKYGSGRLAKMFNLGKTTIKRILKRNKIKIIEDREFDECWRKSISAFKQGIALEQWEKFTGREPYSQNWDNKFKRAIRKRDNHECMLCGIHQERLNRALHVHHINYDKQLTCPENCISLCLKCHLLTQKNRETWKKTLQELLSKKYNYKYEEGNVVLNFQQLELNISGGK